MDRYDVYGNLAIEGLSCGLAIAGLAVELAVAASAPPAGIAAAGAITTTALATTANCSIFVAHAVAVAAGGLSSPESSKQFDKAGQVAGFWHRLRDP